MTVNRLRIAILLVGLLPGLVGFGQEGKNQTVASQGALIDYRQIVDRDEMADPGHVRKETV